MSNPNPDIVVTITADLIAKFAALTGDRSSLHVNDAFARRSAYRRPVAHGMLPLAFLSLTQPFNRAGYHAVLVAIDGRFSSPVFADDTLRILIGSSRPAGAGDEVTFEYQIVQAGSNAAVTRGEATLAYGPAEPADGTGATGQGTLLIEPAELSHLQFEDIQVGAGDATTFAVTAAAIRDFKALLHAGCPARMPAAGSELGSHLPNLLAVLLFSTSVGVRLPGAAATFLEFSARFDKRAALDAPYRLRGTVTHRSASTRIIKKAMTIAHRDNEADTVANGKTSTMVAKPFVRMPSTEELRTALDPQLDGKVVLITGASRGIGETTAKLLALSGARVVINYHRGADDARRVVEEIAAHGGEAVAIAADVSDRVQVQSLVAQARERFGPIDVLVNNAARDFRPVPFLKLTWDDIQHDLDVIAKGAFLCCQEVIPFMLAGSGGKIINISTVATDNPPPDQTKYVMAKSALVGLTRSLSIEFASRNIQVNLVVPSFVETDFVAHVQDGFRKKIAQDTPMRRNASPIDVARAVVFLASSHSSFTTGQKLMVTGGGAPYA